MCYRLKNLMIAIMLTIIWINFGVILNGYNYFCFFVDWIDYQSIAFRSPRFFTVGSHVFSIKRHNLGYQKCSYLSKYVKLFENF